jgi:serine protease Do
MLQQVLQEGKPRLGWIGVRLQTVTPRMAGALGNQVQGGAIVSEVAPNSPGSEVGLRVGDVVQSVDNERITDSRTVDRAVVSAIGKTIQLGVWSNGKTRNVPVAVKEFPQDVWISYKNEKTADLVFTKISDAGFEVADLTDELRAKFHIDPGIKGVVITAVADNTAASGANIRPGYVILKVQMDDVHSRAELAQHLQKLADRGQRDVLLFVRGSNGSVWLTLPMRL